MLQPVEALLDQPSATLADGIAGSPCGPSVEAAAPPLVVFGHMRSHVQLPCRVCEILGIVRLVRAHGDAARAALLLLLKHQQSGIALGQSVGVSDHPGGDQAVAVLHQRVAQIAQLRFLAIALLVQPRPRIGGRCMRLVAALLAAKVASVAVILGAKSLLRCPRLTQRAVHREVFVGHELLRPKVHLREELCATALTSNRSRFLEKTEWSPTKLSMPRPTNQRNSRL